MEQHPKVTLNWALHSLELALQNLEDGPAERRVRRQFHQVLLAVERAARSAKDEESPRSRDDDPPHADVSGPDEAPTRTLRERAGA